MLSHELTHPNPMTWVSAFMQWFEDRAAHKLPTSYDLLLLLSIFHTFHWVLVRPLDPKSKRASQLLCSTRQTTTLATLLLIYQMVAKTAGLLAMKLLSADKTQYAALWAFFGNHGESHLLPVYWWIAVPTINALAFFSMLGLLVRYPVDGVDVDLNRISPTWALRLQHEHGVRIPRRRRGSFGCERYYAEDDDSDSSSLYDRAEKARPEDKVHLPMSTVLKLRREGVDLEKWRFVAEETPVETN